MFNPSDYDQEVYEVRAGIVRDDYEVTHACHHGATIRDICDAAVEDTRKCDGCDVYFCAAHLKDGYCAECDAIDAAPPAPVFPSPEWYAHYHVDAPAPAVPVVLAEPIAAALNGWLTAQARAGRLTAPRTPAPRYAAIANGIYVRVGNGKKNRRAA